MTKVLILSALFTSLTLTNAVSTAGSESIKEKEPYDISLYPSSKKRKRPSVEKFSEEVEEPYIISSRLPSFLELTRINLFTN